MSALHPAVARLVDRLARVAGVEAIALGGSRAVGREHPDSDWDLALYYRGAIDVAAIRALGLRGEVVAPGEWGRLMNGGAWLTLDVADGGASVDLLYRDVDAVDGWARAAEEGRFEIDAVPGYLCGMPTYALAGELALGRFLVGELRRPRYTEALRKTAERVWRFRADFTLEYGAMLARRGDAIGTAGCLARAALEAAHARLAAEGRWALNEKGLLAAAGVAHAATIVSELGREPAALAGRIDDMRRALAIPET